MRQVRSIAETAGPKIPKMNKTIPGLTEMSMPVNTTGSQNSQDQPRASMKYGHGLSFQIGAEVVLKCIPDFF